MSGLASWETMGNLLNLCISFFYLKWVWYQPHKDAPCICSPNAPMFCLASLNFHVLCLCWNILSLPSLHLANSYSSLMSHLRCSFLQKTFCDSNVWMTYIFCIVLWHPILYSGLFHTTVPFNWLLLFICIPPWGPGLCPIHPRILKEDWGWQHRFTAIAPSWRWLSKSTLWSLLPWAQTASWTCSLGVQLGNQHHHIPNYPPLYSNQLFFYNFPVSPVSGT